ncbi:MAG: hypothetical protein WD273_12100 [Trueperaceae bacterium]
MRRYVDSFEPPRARQRGLDWRRLAQAGTGYGWRALVYTVTLALIVGVFYPASRTVIPEDPLLQSFDCAAPPCFPQTAASQLGDVLVKLPPFGYLLAMLLCLPGFIVGIRDLRSQQTAAAGPLITPFVATLVVLIGADVLPRVLNPCLVLGSQLDAVCGEFAGRWNMQEQWNALHRTLLGALPFTALFAWAKGRRQRG